MRTNTLLITAVVLVVNMASQAEEVMPKEQDSDENRLVFRQQAPDNLSITVLDSADLEQVQHQHIQQLLNRTPAISMQRGSGQESLIALRSPVFTGAGACGAFLVMEDSIPVRPAGFCNVNQLFEVHSELAGAVDIHAGPGLISYGANALHGAINILTPNIDGIEKTRFAIRLSDLEQRAFLLDRQGKTDDGGYWFGLTGRNDQGWRADTGIEEYKLSAKWQTELSSVSELTAGFTNTTLRQETAGYITGEDAYASEAARESNQNPEAYRNANANRLWLRYEREESADLNWQLTGYIRQSDMDFIMHFLPGQPLEDNDSSSVGLQLTAYQDLNDSWQITYGLDLETADGRLQQFQPNAFVGSAFLEATLPQGKQYDYSADSQMSALFVDSIWQLSTDLSVNVGIRQDWLSYDYDNKMLAGRSREDGSVCGFGGCRYSRPADREDSFGDTSWRAGINYQLNAQHQWRLSVAEGFRPPQATELYRLQRQQQSALLNSVAMDNVELAYAYRGRDFRFDAVVYDMQKSGVIYRDTDFFNRDDGETEHHGIEWQINVPIKESMSISAQGAFARHRYTNDTQISGESIKGNKIDTAPSNYGSIQIQNRFDKHQLEIEYLYTASYYLDINNEHSYPGHGLVNVRWDHNLNDHWQLSFHVLNLLDKAYAERADYTTFQGYRYFPGTGRSLQLQLSWQLD